MMKYFLVFVFSALLLITPANAEVICNTKFQPTNVRKGPSANDFPSVATLPNGAEVEVVKKVTNSKGYEWVKVVFKTPDSDAEQVGFVTGVAVAENCEVANNNLVVKNDTRKPVKVRRSYVDESCNLICSDSNICIEYPISDYSQKLTINFITKNPLWESDEKCEKKVKVLLNQNISFEVLNDGRRYSTFEGYVWDVFGIIEGTLSFEDGDRWTMYKKKVGMFTHAQQAKPFTPPPPPEPEPHFDVSDTVYISGGHDWRWAQVQIEEKRGSKFKVHVVASCWRMTNNEQRCDESSEPYRIGEYRWVNEWEAKRRVSDNQQWLESQK